MGIYVDYNASAPVDPRVLDVMFEVYRNGYGNADSRTHDYGENARQIVDRGRFQIAHLLEVDKREVFITAGATESDNIAILGLKKYGIENEKKHIITTSIEHKAVLESVRSLEEEGFEIDRVDPDERGCVSAKEIFRRIRPDTLLVSVMHANNETGVIQPVQELGEELEKRNVLFHVDATQSCGKLIPELRKLKYNMLSLSAHKMSGPQGIGALILKRRRYKLPPVKNIMYGGAQERNLRPGTTPVALVAGMGKACELAEQEYESNIANLKNIKKSVVDLLEKSDIEYTINGDLRLSMPNTLNVSIHGVESEALMLSSKQFCGISNGSACTSHEYSPSYVLEAMKLAPERISEAVRISWGVKTDRKTLITELSNLIKVAKSIMT